MSTLTADLAWMRRCADDPARTEAERAIWRNLADELAAYLDRPVATDLFGEESAEPARPIEAEETA